LLTGGALATTTAVLGYRKAEKTKSAVMAATGGDAKMAQSASQKAKIAKTPAEIQVAAAQARDAATAAPPSSPAVIAKAEKAAKAADAAKTPAEVLEAATLVEEVAGEMTGDTVVALRVTGYWPFTAKESERKMEGGVQGAAAWRGRRVVDPSTGRRVKLHTIEDYLAGRSPYFSISSDPEVWPFGQLLRVAWFDGRTIEGRVVDTGQHFTGAHKVYRATGREPLDFCVYSKSTKVLTNTSATVVRGDHWDKPGQELVASKLKGQTVVVGSLHMLGAL
jgi:hypothetical protein